MPEKDWAVGMAEFRTARDPDRLTAHGLGSCVAVALYDEKKRIGGLAHIMLPSSKFHKISSLGKYADTALDALLTSLKESGSDSSSLKAKLVGGANMFAALSYQAIPIGMRNAAASREKLAQLGIPVLAEDVGGTQGRTIIFSTSDGRIEIRKLNQPVVWI